MDDECSSVADEKTTAATSTAASSLVVPASPGATSTRGDSSVVASPTSSVACAISSPSLSGSRGLAAVPKVRKFAKSPVVPRLEGQVAPGPQSRTRTPPPSNRGTNAGGTLQVPETQLRPYRQSRPPKNEPPNLHSTAERRKVYFGISKQCLCFHHWQLKVGDSDTDWWGFGRVHENQLEKKWCIGETTRTREDVKAFYERYKKRRNYHIVFDNCQDFVSELADYLEIIPAGDGAKGIPPLSERGLVQTVVPPIGVCAAGNLVGCLAGLSTVFGCFIGACFAAMQLTLCDGLVVRHPTLKQGKAPGTCPREEANAFIVTEDCFSQCTFYPYRSVEEAQEHFHTWCSSRILYYARQGVIIQDGLNSDHAKLFRFTRTKDQNLNFAGQVGVRKVAGTLVLQTKVQTPQPEDVGPKRVKTHLQEAVFEGNVMSDSEEATYDALPRRRTHHGKVHLRLPIEIGSGKIKDEAEISWKIQDEAEDTWGPEMTAFATKRIFWKGGPRHAHKTIHKAAHQLCTPPL